MIHMLEILNNPQQWSFTPLQFHLFLTVVCLLEFFVIVMQQFGRELWDEIEGGKYLCIALCFVPIVNLLVIYIYMILCLVSFVGSSDKNYTNPNENIIKRMQKRKASRGRKKLSY